MNCSQIRKKLSAFMDSELDVTTSRYIGRHLDSCLECREYLLELRGVDDRVFGLAGIEPSPDFASRVVSLAIRSPDAARWETVSFASRLKLAVVRLSEAVFSLFEPVAGPNTRALDEFSDCPPLSMSFIYFKLL